MSSERWSRLAFVAPLLAATLVLLAAHPGCTTTCSDPETGDPEEVRDGTTDATRSVYESAPWSGKYREFRPQKQYKFIHGLRGTPAVVQAWVGFSERPLRDDPGNISEAAGNMAIVEGVTAEHVQIRNDTCETFYLRVVASNPIEDASAGGASSTGGEPSAGGESSAGADGAGAADAGGVGGASN